MAKVIRLYEGREGPAVTMLEQMNRMYSSVPNPTRFVMNDETYRQFVTEADGLFELHLQPGQTIESRFAGIPIEIDSTCPTGQVYLLGKERKVVLINETLTVHALADGITVYLVPQGEDLRIEGTHEGHYFGETLDSREAGYEEVVLGTVLGVLERLRWEANGRT